VIEWYGPFTRGLGGMDRWSVLHREPNTSRDFDTVALRRARPAAA